MKVHSNPLPLTARDLARPAAPGRSGKPEAAAVASDGAPLAAKPAKPAETRDAQGAKAVPPGLEKVQVRLQELAADERTRGQERALSAITANIARYVEQQASTTPPTADGVAASEPAASLIDTTA